MATHEPDIDNTVRYTKFSGLKFFAFTLIFFVTGFFSIIKFDSYFTDFWKIRNCNPEGYARGEFMYKCRRIKVDLYHYGAIYLGVQKDAVKRAQTVDVLIFGNSRTFHSFSTDAIDQYFKEKGLTYSVFAVEGSSFRSSVFTIEKLKLKPKIVLVNNEIFYTDKVASSFQEIMDFPDKYKTRYQFFHAAQTMQKRICSSNYTKLKEIYCLGQDETQWRSAETGLINWDFIAPPEKQVRVKYNKNSREDKTGNFVGNARAMLDHRNLKNSCPILYLVNSPSSAPKLMENMAEELGVQSAFSHVDNIYTYDDSHLDRPNSEKWANEFVKALDPAIDACLAGYKRNDPSKIDLATSIIDGKSDFEAWKAAADAVVTDNGAKAPDGTQTADVLDFPRPGSKIQLVHREQKIKQGSTLTFGVWLWSDDYASARMQIIRSCSAKTPLESSKEFFSISPFPKRYEISHTFEHDHRCALIQIVGLKDNSKLNVWQGKITYTPPAAPTDLR